jgi:predicted MFS family arabinose efflux permease
MLGNVVTGLSVLAPAGMLIDLSRGLGVSIPDAGLLMTFGAIVLCVGSPLAAWLTSRIERHRLLTATLFVMALCNLASAFAPDYLSLLIIRIMMLAVAAVYTPQAAATVGLIMPAEKRGSAIAYAFVGWSVAAAIGLPLITLAASKIGWRETYGAIAVFSALVTGLLAWRLPRGLYVPPVDFATWAEVFRNRTIVMLLLVTVLQMSGQFAVFTFVGPLLTHLTQTSPEGVSLIFLIYGVCGFIGIAIAQRVVDRLGGYRTSVVAVAAVASGLALWTIGSGNYVAMACGMALWGLGFASTNSMQQVRLVGAAPALAGASVALNSSGLYVGQAIGSALGGLLLVREAYVAPGYVGTALAALALLLVIATKPRPIVSDR